MAELGAQAEIGKDGTEFEAAVEVGAADVDAGIGENVGLAVRLPRLSGETRTTEKSDVPPPMSTTKASSSDRTWRS